MPAEKRKQPSPSTDSAVSLILTERADGGLSFLTASPPIFFYVLVNRRTKELILNDQVRSGPMGQAELNGVGVFCQRLTFSFPSPAFLTNAVLIVIRFSEGDIVKQNLDFDPLPVLVEQSASAK